MTGWATVRCEITKQEENSIPVTIKKMETWRGGGMDLETVPRCEMRAILKAVQVTPKEGTAHIHTDSLGSIQSAKAQLEKGNYRKQRKAQNKMLTTEVIKMVEDKQICLILEWVKGHEDMSAEKHTWISRMKMDGNEMADQEAKQAAAEQEEDSEFPMEHIVTFRHKESGIRSSLKGMIQWARDQFKKQRIKKNQQTQVRANMGKACT